MIPASLRWKLVLPAAVPVVLLLFWIGADQAGHHWDVHGDLLGMFALFLGSLVSGAVVEVPALLKAIPILFRNPEQRTALNISCTGIGVAFVLFCAGVALWFA